MLQQDKPLDCLTSAFLNIANSYLVVVEYQLRGI